MAFRNGPTFPAVTDGLVFHMDPLDSRYFKGGTTMQSSVSPFSTLNLIDGVNTTNASWPKGYFYYDGTDDYINCGNIQAFEYDDAFSFSVWFEPEYTIF